MPKVDIIGIIKNGDTICVEIANVKNDGVITTNDAIVTLKAIPDGLEYQSSNLPRGQFDANDLIWNIGILTPVDDLSGLLCFKVLDNSKAPFHFTFTPGLSAYCESCDNPPQYCITVDGLLESDLNLAGYFGIANPGSTYDDDVDAATGGVAVGEFYELSATNLLGAPVGTIKRRIV